MKSSSLAYNKRETRDKQPLGRDPDRSWCHHRTSVNLFWSQLMDPCTSSVLPLISMERGLRPRKYVMRRLVEQNPSCKIYLGYIRREGICTLIVIHSLDGDDKCDGPLDFSI